MGTKVIIYIYANKIYKDATDLYELKQHYCKIVGNFPKSRENEIHKK